MSADFPMQPVPPIQAEQLASQKADRQATIQQVESQDSMTAFADEAAFSPTLITRYFKTLESRHQRTSREEEAEKAGTKESRLLAIERIDKAADDLNKRNPEMQQRSLLLLRSRINAGDTKEEILKKVLEMYPDD